MTISNLRCDISIQLQGHPTNSITFLHLPASLSRKAPLFLHCVDLLLQYHASVCDAMHCHAYFSANVHTACTYFVMVACIVTYCKQILHHATHCHNDFSHDFQRTGGHARKALDQAPPLLIQPLLNFTKS